MKPYTALAESYDFMLRHVDYQSWYEFLRKIMLKHNPRAEFVVELGCGTGRFGAKFSNDGYLILGIDISANMLKVARTRAYANYRIICSDIREFCLQRRPDFIFAVHDTMNYFTESSQLTDALKNISQNMNENTIFLFDLTTEYNIKKNFDGKKARYKKFDTTIEWENSYNPENSIVTSTLNFINRGLPAETEMHFQRIYSSEEALEIINRAGLELIAVHGDFTDDPPDGKTVMSNYIVRRPR